MHTGVNLLDWRRQHSRRQQRHAVLASLIAALLGGLVMFGVRLGIEQRMNAEIAQQQSLEQTLNAMAPTLAAVHKLREHWQYTQSRQGLYTQLIDQRQRQLSALTLITQNLPKTSYLQRIETLPNGLRIAGQTTQAQQLSTYVQRLNRASPTIHAQLTALTRPDAAITASGQRLNHFQIHLGFASKAATP